MLPTVPETLSPSSAGSGVTTVRPAIIVSSECSALSVTPVACERSAHARRHERVKTNGRGCSLDVWEVSPSDSDQSVPDSIATPPPRRKVAAPGSRSPRTARSLGGGECNGPTQKLRTASSSASASRSSDSPGPLNTTIPKPSRSSSLPPRSVSAPPRTYDPRLRRCSSGSKGIERQTVPEHGVAPLNGPKYNARQNTRGKENLRPPSTPAPLMPSLSSSLGKVSGGSVGGSCGDDAGRSDAAVISSSGHTTHSSSRASSRTLQRNDSRAECGVLACNRLTSNKARNLAVARGQAARDAFRLALLQGEGRPRHVKLGFIGAARAGKTSTLRALAGLPLRSDEESTLGLAVWEVSHELLSTRPGHWNLQEARVAAGAARWDGGVAQYVADCVRPTVGLPATSSQCESPVVLNGGDLDASVLKKMPVDLIASRLNGPPGNGDEGEVVLETYDFGGQEVYYAMHHLFLTDCGVYLACIDLSRHQSVPVETVHHGGDLVDDANFPLEAQGWEALEWWLASVAINAPNSPVAIVGTHDDCLDPARRPMVHRLVHDRIVGVCRRAPDLNDRLWVNEPAQLCFFPIDNSGKDGGVSAMALRSAIDAMASALLEGPLGQPIPLRWAHFWAALLRRLDEHVGQLCRTDDLWRRCSHYGFDSPAELQRFLQHFRGLGALLHFPEAPSEELRDIVCLDPAWVAEAAASVLVAKDRVLQGCTRYSVELRERGLLHSELLAAIWRPRTFARQQRQLIELLQILDLFMPWGHDRQTMPQSQHAEAHQVFLVPSLLPTRPPRPAGEARADFPEEDAMMVYFDFHGFLHRLLPTLFPRVLCALSRIDPGVQILSIYANYALFSLSKQGQAKGDSARSLGGRRQVQKLLVSLQPCAGGELLRCCVRPRRAVGGGGGGGGCGGGGGGCGGDGSGGGGACCDSGASARPSWRHVDRLLHAFRDAVAAWMPRLSFKAGVRCPACGSGRPHPVDLHEVLRDEVAVCPRSGEPIEELPLWLAEWRGFLRPLSPAATEPHISGPSSTAVGNGSELGLDLEYLYASPLDARSLDVHTELEALATLPGIRSMAVRTATTETLTEVWLSGSCTSGKSVAWSGTGAVGGHATPCRIAIRVLCLAVHCVLDLSGPRPRTSMMLEDTSGRGHTIGEEDLGQLLGQRSPSADIVVLDSCNSEQLARCFVSAGARCAVACAGKVFDSAARSFFRAFLRTLAAEGDNVVAAFGAAQRALRLSPQPGLRAEADRFRLLLSDDAQEHHFGDSSWQGPQRAPPPLLPRPLSLADFGRARPMHVEDFTGRAPVLEAVARAFLGTRRVVWLYGRPGIGKSALATEFCRFYGLPGDRLFSPLPASCCGSYVAAGSRTVARGGAALLRLGDTEPVEALAQLERALGTAEEVRQTELAMEGQGRCWLLVLDDIDSLIAAAARPVGEEVDHVATIAKAWWRTLREALDSTQHLRVLFASRQPWYDAPLPCKFVGFGVPSLDAEDAALLLARRSHRPLYQRDLDLDAGGCTGEPLVLVGERGAEILGQLSRHPLLRALDGVPAGILSAGAEVTPQLTSLLAHSALRLRCDG